MHKDKAKPSATEKDSWTIQAVRALREHLGESQQAFATRLGLSMRAVCNYEKDRGPTGKSLAALAKAASDAGRLDLAQTFIRALGKDLELERLKGVVGSWERSGGNPQGYMVVHSDGVKEQEYTQAFYHAFRMFTDTDPEDPNNKAEAEKLLDDFASAVEKTWGMRPWGKAWRMTK